MRISGRPRPAAAVAAAVALAAIAATACSRQPSVNRRPHTGSATASTVGGVQQIAVTAGDDYRFDPSTITVHPGKVHVVLHNVGSGAPHDWSLLNLPGAETDPVNGGGTAAVTFTAPAPGSYTFVCTIHQAQGQTGTLVVLGS